MTMRELSEWPTRTAAREACLGGEMRSGIDRLGNSAANARLGEMAVEAGQPGLLEATRC